MSSSAHSSTTPASLYELVDPAYPRPQFRRRDWLSLDGRWRFAAGPAAGPEEVAWHDEIVVPFPPESKLSGLGLEGELRTVWYRREFTVPAAWQGRKLSLHFGAVDYQATVWLDGRLVGGHRGGHTPFTVPLGRLAAGGHELVVRADDEPSRFDMPRGKQDWLPQAHSIWYPRTTGIWQSVWLEPTGDDLISRLRLTPDMATFSVAMEIDIEVAPGGPAPAGEARPAPLELDVELVLRGERLWRSRVSVDSPQLRLVVGLPDPGIDDARKRILWSPESPNLIDVVITLHRGGSAVDRVESYLGLRSVEARDGRFFLNGLPYFQRLVLDQGYWTESHLAPPGPDALRRDVELTKAMGFNGVRKHQKLEDPRYLYWADRLGLLVWGELPSAYAFSEAAIADLTTTWLEAMSRDYNHPCLVAWVPFNESWGVPDLPESSRQRHAVRALYHLTKAVDGTRPVIDNDGWEHQESDLFTVHDYSHDPGRLAERYGTFEEWQEAAATFRPGGRALTLDGAPVPSRVLVSEFGGIRYAPDGDGWGYSEAGDEIDLLERLRNLVSVLEDSPTVVGYCYTQFSDTFQEQNGLLYADRQPKLPTGEIAEVIRKGGSG